MNRKVNDLLQAQRQREHTGSTEPISISEAFCAPKYRYASCNAQLVIILA